MPVRPITLDQVVGQTAAKTVLNVLIKSSNLRNDAVPHCLFSGPAGHGKTTLALCVANAKGTKLHQINAASINKIKDLHDIIAQIKFGDVLFIDEIHNLKKDVCEWLYTILEDFRYTVKSGGKLVNVIVPKFTTLGASTCIGKIPQPMRERFKFTAEFVEYTEEELCEIVHHVCKTYGFTLCDTIAGTIARTCRGTPRIVVSRTEWIRDYMLSTGIYEHDAKSILNIIKMQGIDEHGLDLQDHRYLKIVKENGPISISQICSKLNADKETVMNDIEPFLIKKGLIEITTKGRVTTF